MANAGASIALATSDDGSRVVGLGHSFVEPDYRAWVWIEGATGGVAGNEQMFALGELVPGMLSTAQGISGNGNFVAGAAQNVQSQSRAIRWSIADIEAGGASMLNLGTLGGNHSSAYDVSNDGRVVVGSSSIAAGGTRAFRWVEGATGGVADNEQMYDLGSLGGNYSRAFALSSDGNVVVGDSRAADGEDHAFRWTDATGMISVSDWLTANGVDVGTIHFRSARGVSDDGNIVVGQQDDASDNRLAYIARVASENGGSGVMDVAEYHGTLYSAAGIANSGEYLTWLPMNGAHHRPLMLTPDLSGDMCAWATGDIARHGASATGMALAEIGGCTDLAGGNVRIGGGLGTTGSWQDLALGGSARMQGQYLLSEIDWQPDGTPLLLSLTGMVGTYQANIERAYSNGAAVASSSGQTNVFGGVVRMRADWLEAAVVGNTSINPYASLAFGGLRVDGYAESGGPFPATFEAQNLRHADLRIGLTAITELSSQTSLYTTLELAHRTGTAAAAVGTVPGLFHFALGSGSYAQTWARVGMELDHKVNESLSFSASAHLASNGRDPSVAGSLGLKATF
jgi:probable HAF family extracellular repeat protein